MPNPAPRRSAEVLREPPTSSFLAHTFRAADREGDASRDDAAGGGVAEVPADVGDEVAGRTDG